MPSIAFATFSSEVLSLYQFPSRRKATLAKMRQVLGEFAGICSETNDLGPVAISEWLASHPERSAATHRSLLSALRAACSYGAYRGYLLNPFDFRRLSEWLPEDELADPEFDPFRRHRSVDEIRRVLAQADLEARDGGWKARRLRSLVYTYAYTGASKSEVLGLRVGDFDLATGIVAIRSHPRRRLKTGARAARLPLAPPLAGVLRDWLPESGCEWAFPHQQRTGPWLHGRHGYRPLDQIKALGLRAGVSGLTILSLRHTVGTLAEGWGIGELMLQRLLRHSRRQSQTHYRHEDLDQLRRAAELVRY